MVTPSPEYAELKKPVRETDSDFVKWIHGWVCIVPGCEKHHPYIHAHHVKTKKTGGSDRGCVPICCFHHVIGKDSIHNVGILTWQKRLKVDLQAEIAKYNRLYDDGEVGPYWTAVLDQQNSKFRAT